MFFFLRFLGVCVCVLVCLWVHQLSYWRRVNGFFAAFVALVLLLLFFFYGSDSCDGFKIMHLFIIVIVLLT